MGSSGIKFVCDEILSSKLNLMMNCKIIEFTVIILSSYWLCLRDHNMT